MKITEDDLTLQFPEPEDPLIEDLGPPVPWSEFMDRIALQTRIYLKRFDPSQVPPEPLPKDRFVLD